MVEYITINKDKYPVRVGYYALKHTSREYESANKKDMTMEDIFGGNIEVYEALLYHSLVAGAKITGSIVPWERGDMDAVLDLCLTEFLEVIPKFFPNSTAADKEGAKEGKQENPQTKL